MEDSGTVDAVAEEGAAGVVGEPVGLVRVGVSKGAPGEVGRLSEVFANEHEATIVSVAAKATINRPDRKIMERPYVR